MTTGSRVLVSWGMWIKAPATIIKMNKKSAIVKIDRSQFADETIAFTSQKGKRVHIEEIR